MVDSNKENEIEFESRTQKKHYAHSMVDLAHQLVALKPSERQKLPINEQILSAIEEAKKITSHIAKKRHFQFIGKLLLNSNHQDIMDAMNEAVQQKDAAKLRTPFLTQWTDRVLEDDFDLGPLYSAYDSQMIQTLRQLIRATKKAGAGVEKNKIKLFQHIRDMDNFAPLPPL